MKAVLPLPCVTSVLLLASMTSAVDILKLELASVLFRHGDRSPATAYPKDPYQESHWPQGFGQLSTKGMQEEFFLGELLKERYVDLNELIHPNYTRVQVYIRSTDYDRTLMSAEAQLAALFPPEGDQVFNSSIPWQPIPVHTVPQAEDNLLLGYSVNCPRYQHLREADTKTQSYIETEKEYKGFFEFLEEKTGLAVVDLSNTYLLHDTLFVEKDNNLTLPSWANDSVIDTLKNLSEYTLTLMFNSKEKNRLTAGVWIGEVLEDMEAKKADPQGDMKLYLYSAHDTTVACMTSAFGVYNGILPPYAATFLIELYSDDNGEYFVSLFYRNDTESDQLYSLSVESCANHTLCTLDEFAALASPLVPEDWEQECGITSSASGLKLDPTAVTLGVLLAAATIILLVFVVGCVMVKSRRSREYTEIV